MRSLCFILTVAFVLGFAGAGHAVFITANDIPQFYDDFEGPIAGNPPDNGANPGSWSVDESGGSVSVIDGEAAEGAKYLRVERTGSADTFAIANLMDQQAVGQSIHAEWMMYIPASGSYQANIQLRDSDDPIRAALLVYGDGTVKYLTNPASPAWVTSSLACIPDQWQKWTIDYTAGWSGASFSFSIDNVPASAAAFTSDNVGRLAFGGNPEGSRYYLDAAPIPEPSMMILTVTTLAGLVVYAWRRRKIVV